MRPDIFRDLAPHVVDKFWAFHKANPKIFKLFEKFSIDALNAGRRRYGIQAISERIRWHILIETVGDEYKINNSHLSCYARLLKHTNPTLSSLFETRTSAAINNRSSHGQQDLT